MRDLAFVRELCKDYTESTARVSQSLQFLKRELRSLRQQDAALLKQLLAINDVIGSIKDLHMQTNSGQPSTLPRSRSLISHQTLLPQCRGSRTLSHNQSIRLTHSDLLATFYRGPPSLSESLRQKTESQKASVSDSANILSLPKQTDLYQAHGQEKNLTIYNKRNLIAQISDNIDNLQVLTVDLDNVNDLTQREVEKLGIEEVETVAREDSQTQIASRSSTTSVDTLQSQADSMYGSSSDICYSSNESLNLLAPHPPVPLGHVSVSSLSLWSVSC